LQALPLALNKQESRQVAQLYIVESLALGMSPYSLSLVEVCSMASVTVCDKIAMSAFNMCVIKLESLYVLHLSHQMMALHWEFLKMFLVASSDFLVQYFVCFITAWGPQDADLVKSLTLAVHLHISTYWQEKHSSVYAM
jgi:hypothetical protein